MSEKLKDSLSSSRESAARIIAQTALNNKSEINILEIGSSLGLNCLALTESFSKASVVGIEPEPQAFNVSQKLTELYNVDGLKFILGVGENLPFPDKHFDLVICHTVIEHVNDVDLCLKEMSRVLKIGGIVHLEAPNYIWPYEPHLDIWCFPLLGKFSVKIAALFQGKYGSRFFLDHLKFVTNRNVTRGFERNGLDVNNLNISKLEDFIQNKNFLIKSHPILGVLLKIMVKSNMLVKFLP